MIIHKLNYELFIMDYIEGNLDEDMQREMLRFLDVHLEIKEEVEDLKLFTLVEDKSIVYRHKNELKVKPELRRNPISWLYAVAVFAVIILSILAWKMGSIWFTENQSDVQVMDKHLPALEKNDHLPTARTLQENNISSAIQSVLSNKINQPVDEKIQMKPTRNTLPKGEKVESIGGEIEQARKSDNSIKKLKYVPYILEENTWKTELISPTILPVDRDKPIALLPKEEVQKIKVLNEMNLQVPSTTALENTIDVMGRAYSLEVFVQDFEEAIEKGKKMDLLSETLDIKNISLESIVNAVTPETFNKNIK